MNSEREVRVDIDGETHLKEKCLKTKRSFKKLNSFAHDANLHRGASRSKKWVRDFHSDVLHITDDPITTGEEEAVSIITLEDVIEELLQVCAIIYSMKLYSIILFKEFMLVHFVYV
ncbi:hypothetical protein Dsin_009414 [Dipteronia sinensis]|uniref:Uncharacterized protein n=1 Tax=Dipteronia sinensis TaxID=43782 RepID=A0AAE0ART9_9ROSI|nr:hypothetical protein Dsin_009414 [Dipteronia sinensis]